MYRFVTAHGSRTPYARSSGAYSLCMGRRTRARKSSIKSGDVCGELVVAEEKRSG